MDNSQVLSLHYDGNICKVDISFPTVCNKKCRHINKWRKGKRRRRRYSSPLLAEFYIPTHHYSSSLLSNLFLSCFFNRAMCENNIWYEKCQNCNAMKRETCTYRQVWQNFWKKFNGKKQWMYQNVNMKSNQAACHFYFM